MTRPRATRATRLLLGLALTGGVLAAAALPAAADVQPSAAGATPDTAVETRIAPPLDRAAGGGGGFSTLGWSWL